MKKPETFDPQLHAELWRDQDHYARLAGIAPHYIWDSARKHLSRHERVWLMKYRQLVREGKSFGLYYGGPKAAELGILQKFSRIAGVFVRNGVDARVRTLNHALAEYRQGYGFTGEPPSVLLILDFALTTMRGRFADAQDAAAMLFERAQWSKQSVLYIDSFEAVRRVYGDVLAKHIEDTFIDPLS